MKKPNLPPPRPIWSAARTAIALPLPRAAASPLPPRPSELTIPAGASVLDDGAVAALSEPARTDLDTLIAEQVIQFREAPETAAAIIDRGCAAYFAAEEAAIEAEQANLEARRARLEADRAAPRDRLAIESARPLVLVESTVHVFDDAPVRVSRGHGRTIALEKGCNVVDASALENLPETALATLASCTIRPARAQDKQATTLAASRTRTVQTHPMNLS